MFRVVSVTPSGTRGATSLFRSKEGAENLVKYWREAGISGWTFHVEEVKDVFYLGREIP